jgi:hypothetical protein
VHQKQELVVSFFLGPESWQAREGADALGSVSVYASAAIWAGRLWLFFFGHQQASQVHCG